MHRSAERCAERYPAPWRCCQAWQPHQAGHIPVAVSGPQAQAARCSSTLASLPRFAQTALVRARWANGSLLPPPERLVPQLGAQLLIDKEAPQAGLIRINRHITTAGEGRGRSPLGSTTLWPHRTVSVDCPGELSAVDRRDRNLIWTTSCPRYPDQPCEPRDDGQLPPNLQLDRTPGSERAWSRYGCQRPSAPTENEEMT